MGLAWLFPGTLACALLWLAATALLVELSLTRTRHPHRLAFMAGFVGSAIAFYWVFHTITDFSGLPSAVAALLHVVFLASAALQFVLFAFFARHLEGRLGPFALVTPVAWIAAETLMPRVFPWEPAHTQLALLPMVQVSEIAGSQVVGFLLFWLVEALIRAFRARRPMLCAAPVVLMVLSVAWGAWRLGEVREEPGPLQPVALLQANMSIEERESVKRVGIDTKRYLDLTRQVEDPTALVVWPESALQAVVPVDMGDRRRDARFDRLFPQGVRLLVGTMTTDAQEHRFNSALAILPDGRIPPPYHKRILMPFGEFMPFQKTFPSLARLNASFVPIDAGEKTAVFQYTDALRASPLICYEDLVPQMSRDSVQAGATLLVNITNDVWFGDTVAPRQHNLIASFRAIENRRWLVRSTNTGTTSVVSPTGETVAALPGFSEGVLRAEVRLLSGQTLYTRLFAERLWWLLTALATLGVLRSLYLARRARQGTGR